MTSTTGTVSIDALVEEFRLFTGGIKNPRKRGKEEVTLHLVQMKDTDSM